MGQKAAKVEKRTGASAQDAGLTVLPRASICPREVIPALVRWHEGSATTAEMRALAAGLRVPNDSAAQELLLHADSAMHREGLASLQATLSVAGGHPDGARARQALKEAIVAAVTTEDSPVRSTQRSLSLDCLLSRQVPHDNRRETEQRVVRALEDFEGTARGSAASSRLLHTLVELLPPTGTDGTFHGLTIAAATGIPLDQLKEQLMGWASSVRNEATLRRFTVAPACSVAEDPIARNIVSTMRNLRALEAELCQAGLLEAPSSFAEIRSLLLHTGYTPSRQTWEMLELIDGALSGGSGAYRSSVFVQKSRDLVADVSREIGAFESGIVGTLRSHAALGAAHELHEITVDKLLSEALPLRQRAIRSREFVHQEQPRYATSVAAFRSAEFAAIAAGELLPLVSRESLGALLSISQSQVQAQELRLADDIAFLSLEFAPLAALPSSPAESAFFGGMVRAAVQEYRTHSGTGRKPEGDALPSFDSYEEAAVAHLLQRYVPGFTLLPGVSFHVKNADKIHDFQLVVYRDGEPQRTILEYHVPRLFYSKTKGGDFHSKEEYHDYKKMRLELPPEERANFDDAVKVRLLHRYHEEREAVMAQNPVFSQHHLITVGAPIQLYYELQKINKGIPGEREFLDEFERAKARFREHS